MRTRDVIRIGCGCGWYVEVPWTMGFTANDAYEKHLRRSDCCGSKKTQEPRW